MKTDYNQNAGYKDMRNSRLLKIAAMLILLLATTACAHSVNTTGVDSDTQTSESDTVTLMSGDYADENSTEQSSQEQHRLIEQYVNSMTADELRKITMTIETTDDIDHIYHTSQNFLLLAEDRDNDAAIYGLYGCKAMILRVGDTAYPIWDYWSNWGMTLAACDYDDDGIVEYAYSQCEGHGTGYHRYGLNIIEINADSSITINRFDNIDEQLNRLTGTYDKASQSLSWMLDGRTLEYISDISVSALMNNNANVKAVDLKSIIDMEYTAGEWYLVSWVGIVYEPNVSSEFDDEIRVKARVIYDGGRFRLEFLL